MPQFTNENQPAYLIRPATARDALALAPLARQLLEHELKFNTQVSVINEWAASPDEMRKQIAQPDVQYFVAEQQGALVGYVKLMVIGQPAQHTASPWPRRLSQAARKHLRALASWLLRLPRPSVVQKGGYLAGIFVVPSARRQHIGQALVQTAEHWLVEQGMPTCDLHVLAANQAARQFWERVGYDTALIGLRKQL